MTLCVIRDDPKTGGILRPTHKPSIHSTSVQDPNIPPRHHGFTFRPRWFGSTGIAEFMGVR
jgi:hypothetical protein